MVWCNEKSANRAQHGWDVMFGFGRSLMVCMALGALVACERSGNDDNDVTDGGLDGGLLRDGVANVWVDPDGCQHWYLDDGIEGYMTPRLTRDGKPRCQDTRGVIILKDGSRVPAEPEPTNS